MHPSWFTAHLMRSLTRYRRLTISGVGFQTALQLAKQGAKVYLGCRSESRAKDAIARMCKASPGLGLEDRIIWLPLDLSVMRLAKRAGEELLSKETRLDILSESLSLQFRVVRSDFDTHASSGTSSVNNAAWATRDYELTEDGIEKAVAVKYVPFHISTTFFSLIPSINWQSSRPLRTYRYDPTSHEIDFSIAWSRRSYRSCKSPLDNTLCPL